MSQGAGSMMDLVHSFDTRVDKEFDRWRGNPTADRVFYTASSIAENSKVWMALSVLRWLRGGSEHRFAAKRTFVAIFVESAIVNLGIKTLVRRERPDHSGEHPHELREPWTSSFPSGHATASFCAATLLSSGDPVLAPAYFALAAVITASRVHVRMHHPSDVTAGALLGVAFGLIARRIAPLRK